MSLLRVMDFVEENAPTTAAAGGAAAAGGIAMSPSLPMTASSGTPPGMYLHKVLFLLQPTKIYRISLNDVPP